MRNIVKKFYSVVFVVGFLVATASAQPNLRNTSQGLLNLFRQPVQGLFSSFRANGSSRLDISNLLRNSVELMHNASRQLQSPEFVDAMRSSADSATSFTKTAVQILNEVKNKRMLEEETSSPPPSVFEGDLLFGNLLAPIRLVSQGLSFSILRGNGLPAIGDVVQDLKTLTLGSNLLSISSSVLKKLTTAALQVGPGSAQPTRVLRESEGQSIPSLSDLGLFAFNNAKQAVSSTSPFVSLGSIEEYLSKLVNLPVAGLLSLSKFVNPLSRADLERTEELSALVASTADKLSAEGEALAFTFSAGLTDPLSSSARYLELLVGKLLDAPAEFASWLGLGQGVSGLKAALQRLGLVWNLSVEQENAVEESVAAADDLIDVLGGHKGSITSQFVSSVEKRIAHLAASLQIFNGMVLEPRLLIESEDVTEKISLDSSLPPLDITGISDLISSGFGFDQVVARLQSLLPINLTGTRPAPGTLLHGTSSLVTAAQAMVVPFMQQQAAQMAQMLRSLQDSFLASAGVIGGDGVNESLGVSHDVNLVKTLQLTAAVGTAEHLQGLLNQLRGVVSHVTGDVLKDVHAMLGASVVGGIGTDAFGLGGSLGGSIGGSLGLGSLIRVLTGPLPSYTSLAARQLEEDSVPNYFDPETAGILLTTAATLRSETARILSQLHVDCLTPEARTARNVIRAQALAGNPAKILANAGATLKDIQETLNANLAGVTRTGETITGSAACEAKRRTMQALTKWAKNVDLAAEALDLMAVTPDALAPEILEAYLKSTLQIDDIPTPPQ